MGPVEVITSVERRRHWSAAQKQAMVEEAEQPGNTWKRQLHVLSAGGFNANQVILIHLKVAA